MSTTYGCIVCGRDMPEVPGAQVCNDCALDTTLRTRYIEDDGDWIFWHEPQLPLDINP